MCISYSAINTLDRNVRVIYLLPPLINVCRAQTEFHLLSLLLSVDGTDLGLRQSESRQTEISLNPEAVPRQSESQPRLTESGPVSGRITPEDLLPFVLSPLSRVSFKKALIYRFGLVNSSNSSGAVATSGNTTQQERGNAPTNPPSPAKNSGHHSRSGSVKSVTMATPPLTADAAQLVRWYIYYL